jgi:hypothetical protein
VDETPNAEIVDGSCGNVRARLQIRIHGNGHEMMLEKNSDEIAKYLESSIAKNVH